MIMKRGFMVIAIYTSDGKHYLNANYNDKTNTYYLPCLTLDEGENEIMWDAVDFIFKDFYNYLIRWKNRKTTDEDDVIFEEIKFLMSDEFVEDILELLEKGKDLGWDKI